MLSSSFSIQFASPFADTNNADIPNDLLEAVERTQMYLHNDTFERLVVGRGQADASVLKKAARLDILQLTLIIEENQNSKGVLRSIAEETTVTIEEKMKDGYESYILRVPVRGIATLEANTSLGLLRGLETFGQMWYDYEGVKYLLDAPIEIEDWPAFVGFVAFFENGRKLIEVVAV